MTSYYSCQRGNLNLSNHTQHYSNTTKCLMLTLSDFVTMVLRHLLRMVRRRKRQFVITATTHLKLLGQLPPTSEGVLKLYTLMSKSCLLFKTITLTVRFQLLFAHFLGLILGVERTSGAWTIQLLGANLPA